MNAVHDEKIISEAEFYNNEEYEYISHDEIVELSRTILEEHREAFIALANA